MVLDALYLFFMADRQKMAEPSLTLPQYFFKKQMK